MQKTNFTASQKRLYRLNHKDEATPFKVIAEGLEKPQRFATEIEAMSLFNKTQGRCLVSFNTFYSVKYLAYKFK